VLLKNTDNLLPLQTEQLHSVAVTGRFARKPRYQGAGSSQVVPTRVDTPYEELQHWLGGNVHLTYTAGYPEEEQPDEGLLSEAIEQAKAADVAIIFAGLPDAYESEGYDRLHLFMPETHNTSDRGGLPRSAQYCRRFTQRLRCCHAMDRRSEGDT